MFSFPKLLTLASAAAFVGLANGYPFALEKRACSKYLDLAKEAATNLQSRYFINGGYPRDQQWVWISANDNFYLRQLDELTGSSDYANVVDTVFNGWEDQLTQGGSYDDLLWVVISYLKSGNVEAAKHYYEFAIVAKGPETCGGGVYWSSKRGYKNAISVGTYDHIAPDRRSMFELALGCGLSISHTYDHNQGIPY